MFCPKCGVENSEEVKFCRKCGSDLSLIPDLMSGRLIIDNQKDQKNKPTWEVALFLLAMAAALFITAFILAFQPMGTGWWFWLLFGAFTMLALGVAQVIKLTQHKENNIVVKTDETISLAESRNSKSLPSKQTEFVSNIPDIKQQTEDLVPPSIVEETTRKLKMDSEGKIIDQSDTDK